MKLSKKFLKRTAFIRLVTTEPFSVSVATGSGIEGAILFVFSWKNGLISIPADCNGFSFPSSSEAFAFAFERGYLREYFTSPDLRLRRKERAFDLEGLLLKKED